MKYIRTKDRIMEVPENIKKLSFLQNFKQADTIEELFDAFVIVRKDDPTIGGELKTLQEMLLQRDCDIEFEVEDDYFYYATIWTDKGLIYAAKMKGVLPNGEIDWKLL